ncbi:MAG: beta-N-acetylhexosaminidase [Actinomycetota bacterium]|nr:beta-N-acetylhexosaminidase [Actinomycetota bacterium]
MLDPLRCLLPQPAVVEPLPAHLPVTAASRVVPGAGLGDDEHTVSHLLADLQRATGLRLGRGRADGPAKGDIVLRIDPTLPYGEEGYELLIDETGAFLTAAAGHGLWNGSRTLLQLFTHDHADTRLPAVRIVDTPRFEWRGAMLDVARHFFGVDYVMRFVELIARYKINRLHLHLTDDQGWRLAVDGWPALTAIGATGGIGNDIGGYFSRTDYAEIVAHAARHFVTIVPEVDMPGHTHAALASVPGLNLDGICPPPYSGQDVGFSSLQLGAPATRQLIHDVIGQLADDTPGHYLHIGGDEASVTSDGDYREFISVLHDEVRARGKRMIGWEEIATTRPGADTLVQHWLRPHVAVATSTARYVMSPAAHTYFDMRHSAECPVGRQWAGSIELDTAYEWNPAALLVGVDDDRIAGVEAALWTERVHSFADVEYLCFPRLLCLAEVGWTPQALRQWPSFRPRLALHAHRLADINVHLYRSPLLT